VPTWRPLRFAETPTAEVPEPALVEDVFEP
jgi:hypothetical protein